MKFKPTNATDTTGCSLAFFIEEFDMDSLLNVFPSGKMDAYYDPERGYSYPWEIGFACEETGEGLYVYERFGEVRIGCLDGRSNPLATELQNFLNEKMGR